MLGPRDAEALMLTLRLLIGHPMSECYCRRAVNTVSMQHLPARAVLAQGPFKSAAAFLKRRLIKSPSTALPPHLLLTATIFLKFSISLRIWSSSRSEAAVVSFSAVALYQCTDVISTHLALVLQTPKRGTCSRHMSQTSS